MINRIEAAGNKPDPRKIAQQYTDWARANLQQFAEATFELMNSVADSGAEDELLNLGYSMLRARQGIGGRGR